jgi:hypothetical protein
MRCSASVVNCSAKAWRTRIALLQGRVVPARSAVRALLQDGLAVAVKTEAVKPSNLGPVVDTIR